MGSHAEFLSQTTLSHESQTVAETTRFREFRRGLNSATGR